MPDTEYQSGFSFSYSVAASNQNNVPVSVDYRAYLEPDVPGEGHTEEAFEIDIRYFSLGLRDGDTSYFNVQAAPPINLDAASNLLFGHLRLNATYTYDSGDKLSVDLFVGTFNDFEYAEGAQKRTYTFKSSKLVVFDVPKGYTFEKVFGEGMSNGEKYYIVSSVVHLEPGDTVTVGGANYSVGNVDYSFSPTKRTIQFRVE